MHVISRFAARNSSRLTRVKQERLYSHLTPCSGKAKPLAKLWVSSIKRPTACLRALTMVSVLGLYYGSLAIIGLAVSLLSLVIVYRQKSSFKSPLGLCLANLASNQLGLVCFGYGTFVMPSHFARHWIWGNSVCFLFGSLKQYFQLVVFHGIFLISLEHYLRIATVSKKYCKHGLFFVLTIITWICSGIWCVFPFLGWGNYVKKEYTCELSMDLSQSGESWLNASFPFFQAFFTFIIPSGCMFHFLGAAANRRRIGKQLNSQSNMTSKVTKITTLLATFAFLVYFLLLLLGFLDWIIVYSPKDASNLIFPLELFHSALSQTIIFISPIWYFIFVPCSQFDACARPELSHMESWEKAGESENERLPPLLRNYIAIPCDKNDTPDGDEDFIRVVNRSSSSP